MKNAWFTSVILAGVLVTGVRAEPADHAPDIACDAPVHDFGNKSEGEVAEHTFTVKNEGDLTLTINNIRTTCGCTVANISDRELEPGETADITARFNTRGKRGHQSKTITVESNDPDEPQFGLTMQGEVSVPLVINPPRVYMSNIDAGAVVTGVVTLTSGSGEMQLSNLASDNPSIAVEMSPVEEGKSYQLTLTTVPPLDGPTVQANIKVNSTLQSHPEINIPVTISVQSVLNVAPRELNLVEQQSKNITRYVVVRPGKVEDYEVTEVVTPDDYMQASIVAVGGNSYQIRIENIVPQASLDGKRLVIKTTAPGMESIEIPFRVVGRSGT